jgi:DNA-binding MarR family transcriptional regulator
LEQEHSVILTDDEFPVSGVVKHAHLSSNLGQFFAVNEDIGHPKLTLLRSIECSHFELVQALGSDPGNISHSVRTLETRGLIPVGRTPGGKADYLALTRAGLKVTSKMGL